ncbi:Rab11 family GTPase, putative [Phytophthora infestans T30-4]|uniref:Rab11 family GTPase, putative n=1 Tax=Phytophthora infestans (strain T30-4) TaxID=403677 RepID=D0NDI0_PHYIT|nr:Rab11 family GTPase, putative [Phytophthora infestans T30-4]EEY56137.1 Rab11 family GTPase, putative [Phytophthora infestans T30-4]|eukprot:XP_002902967.1 Rab11 family GTPase, putative [Phytophthora infestans T30-4]
MQSPPTSPSKSSASPSKTELLYKVIIIGTQAVGKTNLLLFAARGDQFDERSAPTLQPEFVTVKVQRPDWKFGEPNQFIRAQVWDTAGQERFQAISSSHYRRANGALIVYDVSDKNTFNDIFPGGKSGCQWLNALKENSDPALLAAVMLVENKVDKLNETTLFKNPKSGLGWLHDAKPEETIPFRIANSLMFARTSARNNTAELFEQSEKAVPGQALTIQGLSLESLPLYEFLKQQQPPKLEYEPTLGVKTISQALEVLVLRIYTRSKNMDAGASKPSGKAFCLHDNAKPNSQSNACC